MTGTERIEAAAGFLESLAADDTHGYDQECRWGERGDYDCSSAVITAWERAGVPVRTCGASYTGNMRGVFLRCGFRDVTESIGLADGAGLRRGDVLLNVRHHTALYLGGGMEAEASVNERGSATGGVPGDQTGREILCRPYRNYPWDCVLRYGEEEETPCVGIEAPAVRSGSVGAAVAACQAALRFRGFDPRWIDGEAGAKTERAIRDFQRHTALSEDGVCGAETWTALLKGRKT